MARERARRLRRREGEGVRLFTIEVLENRIDNLADLGKIDRAAADDHARVCAVLQDFLDQAIAERAASSAPCVTRYDADRRIRIQAFQMTSRAMTSNTFDLVIETLAAALDVDVLNVDWLAEKLERASLLPPDGEKRRS